MHVGVPHVGDIQLLSNLQDGHPVVQPGRGLVCRRFCLRHLRARDVVGRRRGLCALRRGARGRSHRGRDLAGSLSRPLLRAPGTICSEAPRVPGPPRGLTTRGGAERDARSGCGPPPRAAHEDTRVTRHARGARCAAAPPTPPVASSECRSARCSFKWSASSYPSATHTRIAASAALTASSLMPLCSRCTRSPGACSVPPAPFPPR